MRSLTASEVTELAGRIVGYINAQHAATDETGGPFRFIEEFLTPSARFAGVDIDGNVLAPRSVLEAAIAEAGINTNVPEFSSQWLTQADIMTALAPTLFARSDTFVIRTYGEVLNPATSAVEGRAWCEAVVQRLPEYFAEPSTFTGDALASAFEPPPPDPATPEVIPEATAAQKLNKQLGRRFKVISFRWLTRNDI